jgi:hypothetical protein
VGDEITEMVHRLGACPACEARWSVVEDKHGNVEFRGNRPPTPYETRFELRGAVRVCMECGCAST